MSYSALPAAFVAHLPRLQRRESSRRLWPLSTWRTGVGELALARIGKSADAGRHECPRHENRPTSISPRSGVRSLSLAVAIAVGVHAQSPPQPRFDVVSVKPSPMIGGGGIATDRTITARSVTIHGITIRSLILRAYSLKDYQVSGPAWIQNEYYDILAKTAEPVSDAVQRLMLQQLLASRFELLAHDATRPFPCYELLVAKNGLKIQPVTPDGNGPRYYGNASGVVAQQTSMSGFADLLAGKLGRPVLDKTDQLSRRSGSDWKRETPLSESW